MGILERMRSVGLLEREAVHEAGAPSLDVADLSVRYDNGVALEGISFALEEGERVAVVGPNGAGKSTLFRVIAGVQQPSSGTVKIYGRRPGGHICIAYVVQRSQVDWSFPATVRDVVMMGRVGRIGFLRSPKARDREFVRQCLEVVGMEDLGEQQIGELSGGQQQRMFIARALAQEAELMLMDEPLSGLDVPAQEGIFDILDELKARGVTVMVATHDLNLAADRFDRVMLLRRELLGFGRPGEVFTTGNLASAYGGHLHMVETAEGMLVVSDTCCDDEVAHG